MEKLTDALYRIKRGLVGYVSYLAACEMNESFSEYILYEPTLRILTAQGYVVQCEVPCPGFHRAGRGDVKRLDFVATEEKTSIAIELKWARTQQLNVALDIEKLMKFIASNKNSKGILCIFGRKSHLQELSLLPAGARERGSAVYAEFGVTRYGCRTFEVVERSRSGV